MASLLSLKAQYKALTGGELVGGSGKKKSTKTHTKTQPSSQGVAKKQVKTESDSSRKKQTR